MSKLYLLRNSPNDSNNSNTTSNSTSNTNTNSKTNMNSYNNDNNNNNSKSNTAASSSSSSSSSASSSPALMMIQSMFDFLEQLERHQRHEILDHQLDNYESLVHVFTAIAKIIVGNHKFREAISKNRNLQNQVVAEREACAEMQVEAEKEHVSRRQAETMNETAVDMFEHWRKKASWLAQELATCEEALDQCKDAASFWKARCVCAESALKHLGASDEFNLKNLSHYTRRLAM